MRGRKVYFPGLGCAAGLTTPSNGKRCTQQHIVNGGAIATHPRGVVSPERPPRLGARGPPPPPPPRLPPIFLRRVELSAPKSTELVAAI